MNFNVAVLQVTDCISIFINVEIPMSLILMLFINHLQWEKVFVFELWCKTFFCEIDLFSLFCFVLQVVDCLISHNFNLVFFFFFFFFFFLLIIKKIIFMVFFFLFFYFCFFVLFSRLLIFSFPIISILFFVDYENIIFCIFWACLFFVHN